MIDLEYLHLVSYGRDADQPVVAGAHRTVIDIDAVFVLRLVEIAFYRACLADSGAGRDKQILVIVTSLFEEYRFFVLLCLEVIAHLALFVQYIIK